MVAVEGDSHDQTRRSLERGSAERGIRLDLRTCNHGQRVFGSTEEPERLAALSKVGNEILEGVMEQDDILVYVESDISWDVETISFLIGMLRLNPPFHVLAPLVMAGRAFYDTWGFRRDGMRFSPFHPFHPSVDHQHKSITSLDSAGSCLVMRAAVARVCRIRNDYGLVGLCEDIREKGFRIGLCPSAEVRQV